MNDAVRRTSKPYSCSAMTLADLVSQHLSFSNSDPIDALIIKLIDTPWFQRLRSVSQTANTKLVYMFSEHSRFGHSVGVAFLARTVMRHLKRQHPGQVAQLEAAVSVAALLHDVGHLAPGSHAAFKCWFPNCQDVHEEFSIRIVRQDPQIQDLLAEYSPTLGSEVEAVLSEDRQTAPWSWQVLSGSGWNVDRGNWCYVDSVLAGVDYGKYNISAIVESLVLSKEGHLCFFENRLDAMLHFLVSRHVLYRQVYHHRVLLAADVLTTAIVQRARDLLASSKELPFADETMRRVLAAESPRELDNSTIFMMRESWWNYHLLRWMSSSDSVLADLADRLINRRLFKTVRIRPTDSRKQLQEQITTQLAHLGLDARYYFGEISTIDMQRKEQINAPLVLHEDGSIGSLLAADPLFEALANSSVREWLVVPQEVKIALGRDR